MAELTKAQTRNFLLDVQTIARRHGVSNSDLKQLLADNDLPKPPEPKFQEGDRVAWSHKLAGLHGAGSVLNPDALPIDVVPAAVEGEDNAAHPTPIGTIIGPANEQNTTWIVCFDADHLEHPGVIGAAGTHADEDKLTLTSDELVKVEED